MTPSDAAWAIAKFELRTWARTELFATGEIESVCDAIVPLIGDIERSGLTVDEGLLLIAWTFAEQRP